MSGKKGTFAGQQRLRRSEPVINCVFMVDGVKVIQQFDDYGNHRLLINGEFRTKTKGWVSYRSIARRAAYAGTSEFYSGELPRVFRIIRGKPHGKETKEDE